MTVSTFIGHVVSAMDVINADWGIWVLGALSVGIATRQLPRVLKRFL